MDAYKSPLEQYIEEKSGGNSVLRLRIIASLNLGERSAAAKRALDNRTARILKYGGSLPTVFNQPLV